ncbi:hypothetical protein [Aestuariivita sp.]|uniref:hypothetical protein n=1 Tax=Aestuariivita sp. TaxID=1872407 RepID=UPI002174514D|nr:hypothetical protein [Aestuariivita sp.]MCE8007865.1 hypothetical protein [Aestuariivita sp.]
MSARRTSVFLERETYRRRRIMDAARLLPILGVALFAIPLLWPKPGDPATAGDPVPMSVAVLYIFGVWAGLIVLACLFGLKSRGWGPDRASSAQSPPKRDGGG